MNLKIANAALSYYDLLNPQPTFLGQSENTTFKIETFLDKTFLLRIHHCIGSADAATDIWRTPAIIESELLWLNALACESDLIVPRPVSNRFGQWITILADEQVELAACSLLKWVEGQQLVDEPKPEQLWQVGVMMAKLHDHSSRWSPPPVFARPAYDEQQIYRSLLQLGELVSSGTMSTTDYQLFQAAVARIQGLMSESERTPNAWGLIHADLHDGNYVFFEQQARPIDFSRCGYGFYLFDVGMSLGFVQPPMRQYLLNGYASVRELGDKWLDRLEAFFIAATIENFAFLSINSAEHKGLARAIPDVTKSHLQPYLQGETFLYLS